jgi:hypothetical protein
MCCRYASLLQQHGYSTQPDMDLRPPASPWLFLEPKRDMYSNESLAQLWSMVDDLQLQSRVAIWAMDAAHYHVLMEATHGRAHVIWAQMDRVGGFLDIS